MQTSFPHIRKYFAFSAFLPEEKNRSNEEISNGSHTYYGPTTDESDYRIKCLKANVEGKTPALDLRYDSYKISKGKYALKGLPAMFASEEDSDVETLEIVLKDLYENIYVTLLYGVFEKKNIITRAAVIENRTEQNIEIKRAMSMGLDFLESDMELIHFYGKHAGERQFERTGLMHGIMADVMRSLCCTVEVFVYSAR